MMRFDLFDAMDILKEELGVGSELLVINEKSGLQVRARVFHTGQYHNYQFEITNDERKDGNEEYMNRKFRYGIEAIKRVLDEIKNPVDSENRTGL